MNRPVADRMFARSRLSAASAARRVAWVRLIGVASVVALLLALVALSVLAGAHGVVAAHTAGTSALLAPGHSPFDLCPPSVVQCV